MNPPWTIPEPIPDAQFREIRLSMIFDHHKWDSQFEDVGSLGRRCLILDGESWAHLRCQSEQLWAEALAAEREIMDRPDLCKLLGLGRRLQEACTRAGRRVPSAAMARIMRFDFHFTEEGWRISEANADVPGGFIESSAFANLACACYPGTSAAPDVGELYARAVASLLGTNAQVAFVHATAYTDDRQVMVFLAERFASEGLEPVLASPSDLLWDKGIAMPAGGGRAFDGIVRFFPAEWLPNIPRRHTWERFFHGGVTPQSNPGYSLIPQSKRFPLVWDRLATSLPTWRALLPQTCDPREVDWRRNEEWVLKPALGRVGESIGIRGVTVDKEWREIARNAMRDHKFWAAQRRFAAVPARAEGEDLYPCIGVFVVDGKACGLYGRASRVPLIDSRAQDIPILVGERIAKDRKTQVAALGECR
ncbi:MAG: glutathionylspermidine synthase family protein [Phycisphaerales bacterium]